MVLGSSGNSSIYIYDGSVWQEFINYSYFKVEKGLGQQSKFEINISDLNVDEKLYVKEFAQVLFFSETNLILKGRIQKITYSSAYEATITGFGMEALLVDKEFIKNGDKRVEYNTTSAQTITKEILSSNSDGNTPWIIQPAATGIFSTDFGTISMLSEYGTRLNALIKVSEITSYEWWISQDSSYADYFNLASIMGNQTTPDASRTFNITGSSANCSETNKETDISNMANRIDFLGAGDGINQLHTSVYNASPVYSTLTTSDTALNGYLTAGATSITVFSTAGFPSSGSIIIDFNTNKEIITYTGKNATTFTGCTRGASSTTASAHLSGAEVLNGSQITITSASSFPASGTVRIMEEQITYTSKSGNNLLGITRGANSTYGLSHKSGCYVEKHVAITSPESGSSIYTYGLLDYSIVNRGFLDRETAELMISSELLKKKDPIVSISLNVDEPMIVAGSVQIGDLLTITDSESDISGDYRAISMIYISDYGQLSLTIEASNRSLSFVEQMTKAREAQESLARYAQGSTNIYALNESENCDNSYPLTMRVYIPEETVNINRVKINFTTVPFRGYGNTIANGGGTTQTSATASATHTHNVDLPTHTHDINTIPHHQHLMFDFNSDVVSGGTLRKWLCSRSNMSGGNYAYFNSDSNYDIYTSAQLFNYGTSATSAAGGDDTVTSASGGSSHTHSVTVPDHTHSMAYGISQDTFPTGTPRIAVAVNGTAVTGSPVNIANGGTYELDITSAIANVGIGNWATITFTPFNGTDHNRVRIEANVYLQIFIESV